MSKKQRAFQKIIRASTCTHDLGPLNIQPCRPEAPKEIYVQMCMCIRMKQHVCLCICMVCVCMYACLSLSLSLYLKRRNLEKIIQVISIQDGDGTKDSQAILFGIETSWAVVLAVKFTIFLYLLLLLMEVVKFLERYKEKVL